MDLIVVLKALVMGVIALIMLFILVLMVRAALGGGPKRRPAPPAPARRACGGTRDEKICGATLYRCSNCKEEGCQMKDCGHRGFEAPGNCLRCGFGATMEPV